MASRFYGLNRGQREDDVTDGASTTSRSLEVVIDLTASYTVAEVIQALDYIKNYILKNNWPPA